MSLNLATLYRIKTVPLQCKCGLTQCSWSSNRIIVCPEKLRTDFDKPGHQCFAGIDFSVMNNLKNIYQCNEPHFKPVLAKLYS